MFGFGKKSDKVLVKEAIVDQLKTVFDPEIPVNIYDLGLIYDVDIDDEAHAHIKMTLTTPGCPVAQTFPGTVEQSVLSVEGVNECTVELVWDPPWTQDRMTEAAKLELGLF
ncbi:SUF system Fe-S cluster assembly protein [Legionella sp. W05-934-2]|jgi:FeS assembly SUF system protein|uniref:SUF system Fe-S cluster assembly protein n=1 Tax=Legionella sp. W05-934-2 TaxID=1198649 RepID=UPI003463321B